MIWQDLKISARSLLRAPAFAATAILTLAAAIGMATSVFTSSTPCFSGRFPIGTPNGLAAGVAGSLAISKVLSAFLYGVRATDASTFAILPLFLAMVALTACYVPARRAAKVDPLTALRYE